ncbi:phosphatidylinositol-glycan biosynthesis class S protein-domain-containing protein [Suillus discolor]|uniref:Phosphatidylinositol-glycan biosynthesis class S protein-domain-containing protein n=1 Tax=Suillus discolor TaxID=1912936 RepID=A0A9P7FI44_9AGAM|nr:phosphatidylinositol-glycan biosynthesis class S protein-domain-containing protein [Suillus discolor]KAG2117296.1 phosphatidylinositol-glycan biosynthesis class S protein-domain-containing protein [Suillus discolor]
MNSAAFANTGSGFKDPEKLSFERDWIRRAVLASYWIVIILAFPFWWHLTSIERLALPTSQVRSQLQSNIVFPIAIHFDASISQQNPSLNSQVQTLLHDSAINEPGRWRGVDIRLQDRSDQVASSLYTVALGGQTSIAHSRNLRVNRTDAQSATRLSSMLSDLIAPPESGTSHSQRVVQYSDHYRLAFTLLNEDATPNRFVATWDVQAALAEFIYPLISQLSILHNFTVESQVQYHAPLAFEPRRVTLGDTEVSGLTQEDLTVFINSAEWTLASSVSNDPVLHFVLFVPSETHSPMNIIDSEGRPINQSSFLLPQWGSIFILNNELNSSSLHLSYNDLKPVFRNFATQLAALLGVPPVPLGLSMEGSFLSDWQLDALLRHRALQNVQGSQDTLHSIIKLVDQINNMPVGQVVRDDVLDALASLHEAYRTAATSPALALRWSSKALSMASRAFFNPGMLALLYFPAEHKYAVYTPLFASISVPLVVALIRDFMAWKRGSQDNGRR